LAASSAATSTNHTAMFCVIEKPSAASARQRSDDDVAAQGHQAVGQQAQRQGGKAIDRQHHADAGVAGPEKAWLSRGSSKYMTLTTRR
jgi:hypothetical protein